MTRMYLNDGWIFYSFWNDTCIRTSVAAEGEKIRIPHTAAILPYNYADPADYSRVCGYVRMLSVPEDFFGRELWLTFEGVAHGAEVFVNGRSAARHYCGYTAFSVNIAPYVDFGRENRIAVRVDCREDQQVPPVGSAVDELTYGGIYRDVYLDIKKPAHIEDIFVRTKNRCVPLAGHELAESQQGNAVLSGGAQMVLSARLSRGAMMAFMTPAAAPSGSIKSSPAPVADGHSKATTAATSGDVPAYLQITVFDRRDNCLGVERRELSDFFVAKGAPFESNKSRTVTVRMDFDRIAYWDVEQPRLYFAEVLLCSSEGHILDSSRVRFGFRDIRFREDGFYLNGRRLKLIGLNRHQSYPYVGCGTPASMQRLDAELLKHELGVNAVRTVHYPASQHFIDRCDELGLLVFTELPGWKTAGSQRLQSIALNNVREMIAQYRNHPSIILWNTRGDESADKDDLYIRANAMARRMDPTRQSPDGVWPDIVSKPAGHTYPSKMFDNEEHRLMYALRHAHVLENVFANDVIAGSFGGCMADYQAHTGSGSGDGICYHGVMDMFRNPKLAGGLYASQGPGNVCELASAMAPGDYGADRPESLWIFTNCDYVRAFREGSFLGKFYPDREQFGHLPHPPINIPGQFLYGSVNAGAMGETPAFRFEFIKDGRLVRRMIRRPATKAYLDVLCSHTLLVEKNSYDMALLRIRAVNAQGLLLPYYNEPVRIKASGPIAIVGPDTISLKGGCFGTLVRTLGGSGNAKVTLFAQGMEPVEIYLEVEKYRRRR